LISWVIDAVATFVSDFGAGHPPLTEVILSGRRINPVLKPDNVQSFRAADHSPPVDKTDKFAMIRYERKKVAYLCCLNRGASQHRRDSRSPSAEAGNSGSGRATALATVALRIPAWRRRGVTVQRPSRRSRLSNGSGHHLRAAEGKLD
jgi:hypothetical protein